MFSDDEDQGVLTNAALDAIDKEDSTLHGAGGPEERVAIIDMDYDGRTVLGISSLSPEWQALRTEVWQAPGRSDSRPSATDRGLMLRVSGKESQRSHAAGKGAAGDMDDLVKKFAQGLESLDEVLGEEKEQGQEGLAREYPSQKAGNEAQ